MPTYKYKNSAGRTMWYASFFYTDWTGTKIRKVKRGFATQREAKEYERDFLENKAADPRITFSALVENYFKDCETRLKPTTIGTKRNIVDNKILPYFGDMPINEIDQLTVRRWQNMLIDYRDADGNPYAQTYLRSIHTQLSAIFNYAIKYYRLKVNPCAIAGLIGRAKADEMHIWTHDQYKQFREQVVSLHYKVAFDILFYCGLREGELLALMPSAINGNIISVRANFQIVDGRELIQTPKTEKGIRDVTMPDSLALEVGTYIGSMIIGPDERIFHFTKSGLTSEFRKRTEKAGLPQIRIHDLRHSHVAMLIHMGIPIEEISRRIGHDNTHTTWSTYAHLYPGKDQLLAKKIDNVRLSDDPLSDNPDLQ